MPAGPRRYLLLFALMTTIWGGSYFFTALALESFGPLTLVALRLGLATILLGTIAAVLRLRLPTRLVPYLHLVLLGAFNITVPLGMLTWAQLHVTSSMASVLSSTTPIFVFLFATLILRTERLHIPHLIGVVVAFAGVVLLYGFHWQLDGVWVWPLAIVVSSAIFAAGNLYSRFVVGQVHPLLAALLQLGFGMLFTLPVALALEGPPSAPSPISVLALLELGLLGSGLCYLLYFTLLRAWGSTRVSLNTYLQPVVGIVLGVMVLQETLAAHQWAALLVIFLGVSIFGWGGFARAVLRRRGRAFGRDPRPADRGHGHPSLDTGTTGRSRAL